MARTSKAPEQSGPHQDDSFTRFELRSGIRRVVCTVSPEALEGLLGLVVPSTVLQRRQTFDRFRIPINQVAQRKIDALAQAGAPPAAVRLTMADLAGVMDAIDAARPARFRTVPRREASQPSAAG